MLCHLRIDCQFTRETRVRRFYLNILPIESSPRIRIKLKSTRTVPKQPLLNPTYLCRKINLN